MAYKKYYSKNNPKNAGNMRKTRNMRKRRRLTGRLQPSKKNSPPIILGIVHAKWCGYCKKIMDAPSTGDKSIWQKTKDAIGNMATTVEIEESEIGTKLKELNAKYGVNIAVNGFPTIFKIKNGKLHTDFMGERTPESLSKWVKE